MTLVKWYPAREMAKIGNDFDSVFKFINDQLFSGSGEENENVLWTPATDILENEKSYLLKLDLPGVEKDNVKISFKEGTLTVTGERKNESEERDGKCFRIERTFGGFSRSFTLPELIKEDKISATFSNGTLTIEIPKAEEAKPIEIKIQ